MRKTYPSDLIRKQFEQIQPVLESARKRTSLRKVELYEIFCALLYVLKSGCQWRMLPEDFPKWQLVYDYWKTWSKTDEGKPSLLEQLLKKTGWRGAREPWMQCHSKYVDS